MPLPCFINLVHYRSPRKHEVVGTSPSQWLLGPFGIKGNSTCSIDFIGLNYYTATEKNGVPIGEPTEASWIYIYPKGIRELVLYVKSNYMNLPIYITEHGMADFNNKTSPIKEALNDSLRIKYHSLHSISPFS
ncbi:hypothetical protein SLA2020_352550 [Shorea laevis]